MQEMNKSEVEMVNGGYLAVIALAVAVIGSAEQLRDFYRGVRDGIAEAQ